MSRAGNDRDIFVVIMGVTGVVLGIHELRDQDKGVKLNFVQGLLLTHY